jgi:hypothetical protein
LMVTIVKHCMINWAYFIPLSFNLMPIWNNVLVLHCLHTCIMNILNWNLAYKN